MQKRESYYAEMVEIKQQNWPPAPREYSTLICNLDKIYLIGGQNFEMNKEIASMEY
jgi:hypothetical protein